MGCRPAHQALSTRSTVSGAQLDRMGSTRAVRESGSTVEIASRWSGSCNVVTVSMPKTRSSAWGVADVLRDGGIVAYGVVLPPRLDIGVGVGRAQLIDQLVQLAVVPALACFEPQSCHGVACEDVPVRDALAGQRVQEQVADEGRPRFECSPEHGG